MENPPPYTPYLPKVEYVPPGAAPSDYTAPASTHGYNRPPPSGYIQHGLDNTVVLSPPAVLVTALGPNSQTMTCPFCHHTAPTKVQTEANTKTHLFAVLMCIFLCWPCCIIPYCTDSCKSKQHFCSNCGAFLGAYDD